MTGGSIGGSSMLSKGRRSCKVCIKCGKNFTADEDKDDSKLPFSKEETSLLVNEEGSFSCGLHRRDQMCHDCFQDAVIQGHLAHADHLEHRAFRDTMDGAVKRIWKNIYLKEGDKVPWSEDEEKAEVKLPSSPSSSPRGNKKCAHCGKGGDLKRCSKCLVVFYCSESHQAVDYAKHKASCQAPKIPVNDTAQATTQVQRQDEKPSKNNSEQPVHSMSYKSCAHCGKTKNLSMCARCKATYYCSKGHQVADYPNHKPECRLVAEMAKIHEHRPDMKSIWMHKPPRGPAAAAQPAQMPVITWSELRKMHPNVATGRTLEVTIVSEPSHKSFAPRCDGRDAEGMVMRVALATHRPPQGFRKGCVLRWRNPWFHFFLDGATGANIENWDLQNVSVE